MALKAWPQPPLMSSTATYVALSFDSRVALREEGVMPDSVAVCAAWVSVGAAIGAVLRRDVEEMLLD